MGRKLACLALLVGGIALAQTKTHKMLTPDQLQWGKPPPGLPPALEMAVVEGDPMVPGVFVVRARIPDGVQIRPHWHSKDENITVLSGHFLMSMGDKWDPAQMKDFGPGGFTFLPATERHAAMAKGETIIQIHGPGPFDIHYVNPSDDPRNKRSSR